MRTNLEAYRLLVVAALALSVASWGGRPALADPQGAPPGHVKRAGPLQIKKWDSTMCLNSNQYAQTLDQEFMEDGWRRSTGTNEWAKEYPWGRTNPNAGDAAYHISGAQGLGNPIYDPFSIVNGNTLAIQANTVANVPGLQPSQIDGYQYVSGVMSTAGPHATHFRQQWGYYEVRTMLPKGQGFWPSFWMLDSWGGIDEVDAFEFLGNDVTTIYQSVHYGDGSGGSYAYHPPFDPTKGYHNYGVLLSPTTDIYYVDGVQTHSVPNASLNPMYFMVSFSIGAPGSWPGPPDGSTPWPSYLYVQYFHAYAPTGRSC